MDLADLSALLGEDLGSAPASDIWVLLPETADAEAAARLLAEARRLADGLGCYVHAVTPDESAAARAIPLGADRAHAALDPYAYLSGQHPEFILLPGGQEALAAALAQGFGAGLLTQAIGGLEIDNDTRALRGRHPVYGGDYYLDVEITSPIKLATVDWTTLPPAAPLGDREGEVIASDSSAPQPLLRDLGPADYEPPAWRPLTRARVIVSMGRGLGQAGVELARQLAERLGAELAGDRSARDSGWVDEAHEVGVTAQEVAPDVYLALGILGDTVHNAAIAGARRVVAIHPNPDAPIFALADLAVVDEPAAIARAMLEPLGNAER
jgi:electron transfer flavoprotein alpha subunit